MRKSFTLKTLLVAAAMVFGGGNFMWAATIATLGSNDNEWTAAGSNTSYTLAANKTLTLTFTVTSTKGDNEKQGYYTEINQSGSNKMGIQPGGGFYYWGDDWWIMDHMVKNDRSWDLSDFTAFIQGAMVELTIKRIHTQLLYYADITTTASQRHYLRLISKETTFDENADVEVKLGADYAVLTSITDVTTDESITGTLIGKEDNSVDFNGEGAVNQAFTLAADKSLTLNFINYSSKIGYGDNWLVEIQNGDKYLDLRSDYWGWEYGVTGYYYHTEDTASPGYFTLTSTTGGYFDNFPKALHKANVNLTVSRSGSVINISAVQTCVSGEVKTQTYTLNHSDFASGDVTVRLYAAYSHLDLLPVTKSISAAGWATYCSPYALNLADVDGLTAYTITGNTGTTLTLEEQTGTVPAGTGLLLKGATGSYNIPIVGSSLTDVASNILVGVNAATNKAADEVYVLMNGTEGVGFYQNANTFTVGANSAYIPAGSISLGVGAKYFRLEGQATGIEVPAVAEAEEDGVLYNVAGQQVGKDYKGIVIKNGKKYLNK